tara:strand:+ start:147 stop:1388 length:1242 start_codon:yes stop_codon:yes gene_type:complete
MLKKTTENFYNNNNKVSKKFFYCKKCVINNHRPITSLENKHINGTKKPTTRFINQICDACRWADEKKKIDWDSREKKLEDLCERHRRSDGGYDIIIPSSAGKDSRYVTHYLKTKYNMNPLTVTWKPHLHTDIGLKNVWSFIDQGFDNYMVSPNSILQKLLSKKAFENLGHPFQPFIVGQRSIGPKFALMTGAKLVFYGENVAEYGNRIEDNYLPTMDPTLYTNYDFLEKNKSLDKYYLAGLPISKILKDYNLQLCDFQPYSSPNIKQISDANIEVHYMSYYRNWVPQDNYYYAVEKTNFEPNPVRRDGSYGKYSGIDDKMEDLHYYMQYIKFGMGRATWDAAQEIRTNKITREEGVALVKKYDHEIPKTFLNDILEYLGISETYFWEIIEKHRNKNIWEKLANGKWKLKVNIS